MKYEFWLQFVSLFAFFASEHIGQLMLLKPTWKAIVRINGAPENIEANSLLDYSL